MPNRKKRGGTGYTAKPSKRHTDSFVRRYGMTAKEWRELKKKDPQKADQLRQKANPYK